MSTRNESTKMIGEEKENWFRGPVPPEREKERKVIILSLMMLLIT